MKKYILSLAFVLSITLSWASFNTTIVQAQTITDSKQLFGESSNGSQAVDLKGNLPNYTTGATSTDTQFRAIVDVFTVWLKRLMMAVAIAFITWGGLKLIISRGNEEQAFTQRKNEAFAIAAGFLLFLMASVSVDNIFFGFDENDLSKSGSIFRAGEEQNINRFATNAWIQMEGVFDFVTSFIVIISTLFIIISALRMLTSWGNEEAMSELKNKIIYSLLGLAMVISIKQIVYLFTKTRYGALDNPNTNGIITFISQWANVILGFIGFLAVIALIWAGFILIVGFGDDSKKETAQNIVKYVIIALVLVFSSWTIINYFINAGAA